MKARGEFSSKPKRIFGVPGMNSVIADEAFSNSSSKTISAAGAVLYAYTIDGISACAIECIHGAVRS